MRRRLAVAAAALAVPDSLARGGGSGTSSTTAWADDLCTAVTSWTGALGDSLDSLKGNLSRPALRSAADDAHGATETFVDELRGLGPPDTAAGAEAQDVVDAFA